MNIYQLRKTMNVEGIDTDARIVRPAPDHSYRVADVEMTTAIRYPDGHLAEDFGDDHNEPGGTRVPVLLVQ